MACSRATFPLRKLENLHENIQNFSLRQPGPKESDPEGWASHIGELTACKSLSSFKHFPSPDIEPETEKPDRERLSGVRVAVRDIQSDGGKGW